METEINIKWGIYPWFAEYGKELIHPEDYTVFKKEASNCKVFECIGDGDYITLKYNNNLYRVKDKLFRQIPAPAFNFGQKVKIVQNNNIVIITDIMWHFNKQKHYYLVSYNNRKKKKRYFEEELMQI